MSFDMFNGSNASSLNFSARNFTWTGHSPCGQDTQKNIVLWYAIMMVLSLGGAANNIVLLAVIFKNRRLRTGAGVLIAHMIFIFTIMCIVFFPITSTVVLLQAYNIQVPVHFCRYIQAPFGACVLASNWADVFLGVNRFVAICFPYHYTAWTRKTVILTMIGLTWLVAVVVNGLNIFQIGGDYVATGLGMCIFKAEGSLGNAMMFLGGFVPYSLVGVVAMAIFCKSIYKIWKNHRRRLVMVAVLGNCTEQPYLSPQVQRRLGVAKMLLVSFLFGFFCNLPVSIIMTNFQFVLARVDPTITLWFRFLFVGPFAINPVIFYAMNDDYRAGFIAIFRTQSVPVPISTAKVEPVNAVSTLAGNTANPIIPNQQHHVIVKNPEK